MSWNKSEKWDKTSNIKIKLKETGFKDLEKNFGNIEIEFKIYSYKGE